jgi:hypothetical protein
MFDEHHQRERPSTCPYLISNVHNVATLDMDMDDVAVAVDTRL